MMPIDYILAKQRFRNGVKCCKSYPGADIASDHKLVAMKMFKLKRLRKPRRRRKWDIERLKRNSIPFQKNVEDTIKPNSVRNVNEGWTEFQSTLPSSAQKDIGHAINIAKRGNRQIGGARNVIVEKFGKD
jgi:hypothetical protein